MPFNKTHIISLQTKIVSFCQHCNWRDRKSTRLNSSHGYISYAVFCLKKKKKNIHNHTTYITSKSTTGTHQPYQSSQLDDDANYLTTTLQQPVSTAASSSNLA